MDLVRQTAGSDLLHHEPGPGNHIGSLKLKGRPMMIFDAMIFLRLDRIFGLRLVDLELTKNPQIKNPRFVDRRSVRLVRDATNSRHLH